MNKKTILIVVILILIVILGCKRKPIEITKPEIVSFEVKIDQKEIKIFIQAKDRQGLKGIGYSIAGGKLQSLKCNGQKVCQNTWTRALPKIPKSLEIKAIALNIKDQQTSKIKSIVYEKKVKEPTEPVEPEPIEPTKPKPTLIEGSPFGIFGVFDAGEYSQFLKDMKNAGNFDVKDDYYRWAGNHMQNLNAKWSRQNTLLIWALVEPKLGQGYDWQTKKGGEEVIENAYRYGGDGFNLVLVIDPNREESIAKVTEEEAFKDFVKASVEKYGDKVKYWQAYNEPFPNGWKGRGGTTDTYVEFIRLMSEAVREADLEAKIILGAEISDIPKLSNEVKEVISKLEGEKVFDIVDIHYWQLADGWKMETTQEMRSYLDQHGYTGVEIWSMEHGTYVNQPTTKIGTSLDFQSEKQQALFLIKSYVYNLANDVDNIFWNNLIEWSCFGGRCGGIFDNMGLVSDGRNSGETLATLGVERLSYYTYKLMTDTLEGSDWNNIQKIQESNNIYIYKFNKNNKNIWVAWNEGIEKEITISDIDSSQVKITEAVPKYESGQEVTDYNNAFETETKTVSNGKVTITLSENPVFVEEQ